MLKNESDSLAVRLYCTMVKDFRRLMGNTFATRELSALLGGVEDFRALVPPALGEVSILRFKAYRQLHNFFKRYRFESEMTVGYEEKLENDSYQKYESLQLRLATYHPLRATTKMVLAEARKVCRLILDEPYEPELYRKFGRRAENGCKLNFAYFDYKLGVPDYFTCSEALLPDLKKLAAEDSPRGQLFSSCLKLISDSTVSNSLTLSAVPKSWKIHRLITPLTTFGLFWSYGVGGYVEMCLRKQGLDISRLQEDHKILAQKYSNWSWNPQGVTADGSSASDCILSRHLNAVLPRWLYNDLKKTFVRHVRIKNRLVYTESVLPMGNGATFPIETLYFYCIIKAVGNLLNVKGTISVYGDDMIYPRRIHEAVVHVFQDLGLEINAEKTCVDSHFRESCGGDFYHGAAVRPFLYPEDRLPSGRLKRLQYIYKIANTLFSRWTRFELPECEKLLQMEILALTGEILYVPPSFPDTSGWKTLDPPKDWYLSPEGPRVSIQNGTAVYRFKYIKDTAPATRSVFCEELYYWAKLAEMEASAVVRYVPPPPGCNNSWGRYDAVLSNRVVANWFLKSIRSESDGLGISRPGKGPSGLFPRGCYATRVRNEALHEEGTPAVDRAQTSIWT